MKAHIGDRLVLEGAHIGDGRRTAVITALHHRDGHAGDGAKIMTAVAGLVPGSASQHLIHRAACPVLVVRQTPPDGS